MELAAGEVKRVDQTGRGNDCRAVLVVVEHWNVEELAQPLFDDEAFRRLDVLQIDPAEGRVQKAHAIDELVDVAGVDLEIDRVDIGKAFEQRAFALHDGLGSQRAEIPEPQDRGAVRDHRDEMALDVQARERHTRRIGERQIPLRRQWLGRRDRQLSRTTAGVELQGLVLARANDAGVHIPRRSSSVRRRLMPAADGRASV